VAKILEKASIFSANMALLIFSSRPINGQLSFFDRIGIEPTTMRNAIGTLQPSEIL